MSLTRRSTLGLMAGAVFAPSIARAQSFPSKVVTLIVPYPAGGPTDAIARFVAQDLSLIHIYIDQQDALRLRRLMGFPRRQHHCRLSENERGREHEAPGQNDSARCGALGHDAQRNSAQKRWMRRQASSSFSSEVA